MLSSLIPAGFSKLLQETFRDAEERLPGGTIDRFYQIDADTVRLRFASPDLLSLVTPALEHLAAEPCLTPALTVCLWDSATTNTGRVAPPWSVNDYLPRGEVRGYNDDDFQTSYYPGLGILSMLNRQWGAGFYWLADARQLPSYERAAPLLMILSWWASERGRTHLFLPDIGGVEVLSQKALPALRDRNYEFTVVTSHGERKLPNEMRYDGIPIHRFPMWQSLSRRDLASHRLRAHPQSGVGSPEKPRTLLRLVCAERRRSLCQRLL